MSPSPDDLRLPVHPHQLEVQEFSSYALILDLRSAADFAQDHVPGAVNLPWEGAGSPVLMTGSNELPDQSLQAEEAGVAPWYALHAAVAGLNPGDAVLVYGGPGGVAAQVAAERLRQGGQEVDELPGGYGAYRRWVEFALDLLPRTLRLLWVRSPPGGGATCVLDALRELGGQTVSLSALCGQQLLPGLTLAGEGGLTQGAFESRLVDALRGMDPAQPVWVDEVLEVSDTMALPEALRGELRRALMLRVVLPIEARVAKLRERMAELSVTTSELAAKLNASLPEDMRLQLDGAEPALETVLRDGIDPLYAQLAPTVPSDRSAELALASNSVAAVWRGIAALPQPWQSLMRGNGDNDPV